MRSLKIFFLVFLLAESATADVRLPALIADNMVLQQNSRVALWGWADAGEEVSIIASWLKKTVKVKAGSDGNWKVHIQTPDAGGPHHLNIKGKNEIIVNDVLSGEVWLCSGQSNMEFPLGKRAGWRTGVFNYQEEIAKAKFPQLRMFTVKQTVALEPLKEVEGTWHSCSPETAGDLSAVAYYFGREIHEKTGFPVGLIHASWGGTPAESWTKKTVLENDSSFHDILKNYQARLENYPEEIKKYHKNFSEWQVETSQGESKGPGPAPKKPADPLTDSKSPSVLYNGMISPLIPYAFKGVIWYQGESNSDRASQYQKLFPALIKSWRDDWKHDFPFYFVQIAPHYQKKPEIREAQLMTYRSVKNTGMAVVSNAADSLDIHPRDKETVGRQLSLWPLANLYGKKDLIFSGPLYKKSTVEGDKIRIDFDFAEGLTAFGGSLKEFEIAGPDLQFVPAYAVIDGNSVLVSNASITTPVAVRFAWKNYSKPNLFNKAGLPASPFRTQ